MIKPHVATEIACVWQQKLYKLLEIAPVRKDSRPLSPGPDDQARVPRRHGNLRGACVWQQKLEAVTKKTTWKLSCWKLNRSDKTQLPAFKLLEKIRSEKTPSAAFNWSGWSSPRATSPRKSWRCLRLASKNFRRSQKNHLEAKLLETEPVRQDTVACF